MDDFAAQLKSSLHALSNSPPSNTYSYPSSDEEEEEEVNQVSCSMVCPFMSLGRRG